MDVTTTIVGPGLVLHRITDEAVTAQLRAVMRDMANDDSKAPRYPGPNPVSLDSSHFPRLASEPYFVCEKTDGVRYALVCCRVNSSRDGSVVKVCALVDRALTGYLLPLRHVPRAMFQGSLLDGELAWNKVARRWEFLVFDAVCVSGVPVMDGSLVDRMDAVHRVLRVYREAPEDPVALRAKTFFPGAKFLDFERHLATVGESFDIDGLVLTPAAAPVRYGRHQGMLKLKFDARHTVDFLVGHDGLGLAVFDAGKHVTVGRLLVRAQPGVIAECSRVEDTDDWDLVGVRTDKTTANDMYTYRKTLINMREALTIHDVHNVITSRHV